jgi:FkbM family methyltransferase
MSFLTKNAKKLLQTVTGRKFFLFKSGHYFLLNPSHIREMWFLQNVIHESILEDYDVSLILDVGANDGQFAKYLRDIVKYKGKIISFEPVTQIFDKLSKEAEKDPNWFVYQIALGSQNDEQKINVTVDSQLCSFLEANKESGLSRFDGKIDTKEEETVTVRRLDTFIEENIPEYKNEKIFLKMDTQGYDMEAFKGLGDMDKYVVALQSEVSVIPLYEDMPHWTDSIETFEKSGFSVVCLTPITRDSMRIIEYDCLMVNNKYSENQ